VKHPGLPGFVLACAVAGGFAGLALAAWPVTSYDLAWAIQVGVGVYGATVATSAFVRYRGTRDPHALFVGVGVATLAVQAAVIAGWILVRPIDFSGSGVAIPQFLWLSGWLVAGACFLLAEPPWDRRGRRPAQPVRVLGRAAAVLAVFDVVVIAVAPDLSIERYVTLAIRARPPLGVLGVASWLFLLLTGSLLAVAAARELMRASGRRSAHTWMASAWVLAVALQFAAFVRPTQGLDLVQWADILQPVVLALVFAGSLTAQHAESSRMRRTSDRAEQVLGGRAEIASMVAHEMRGPVSTIRGLAGTTVKNYERLGDPERLELMGLIEQEAANLLEAVNQASLALKVDAETLTLDRRAQELAPLVRDAVEKALTDGHTVDVDAPAGIAADVDAKWLTEAIRQGVDNAAKFSPVDAPISVRLRTETDQAWIEITDDGPGVPAGQREAVFERYAAWRPTGYEDRRGSGLGLFICRGIVREQGGEASLGDGPGGGSMLRIRLPLRGDE
jgi:signal transduction histidine kinase